MEITYFCKDAEKKTNNEKSMKIPKNCARKFPHTFIFFESTKMK